MRVCVCVCACARALSPPAKPLCACLPACLLAAVAVLLLLAARSWYPAIGTIADWLHHTYQRHMLTLELHYS